MMIKTVVEMKNGMTTLEVVDTSSGLISCYVIPTGTLTQFMKELRSN